MKKLTRRQIFNSLVFPIMTTIWGVYNYLAGHIFWGFALETDDFIYFAAVGIGGILCVVLTITLGIETGQYFLPRLLILLSTIFVSAMAVQFLGFDYLADVVITLVSLVFSALFFKRCTRFSEWIIIFFSNPVLYGFAVKIYWLSFYQEAAESSGIF